MNAVYGLLVVNSIMILILRFFLIIVVSGLKKFNKFLSYFTAFLINSLKSRKSPLNFKNNFSKICQCKSTFGSLWPVQSTTTYRTRYPSRKTGPIQTQ